MQTNHKITPRQIKLLLLLLTGFMMAALDISIVGPAIPAIEKAIRMDPRDLSWIFSIYVLFNLVGISLMARLSDYYGRRPVYMLSLLIYATGSLLVSLSHDFTLLLIGRGIQGFGASSLFPVALATIGDIFPVEKRGRMLGLIGAIFGFAFILGPFIAGFVLMQFHWNALFIINIPVALILFVFSWFLLPGKQEGPRKGFDLEGILLIGIILASFTLAINFLDLSDPVSSITSFPVLPLLLVAVILTPILFMLESTHDNPVINVNHFKSRQVRVVGFIALGIGLFQSNVVFLPKLAVGYFSVVPSAASFMLLPMVIATAVSSPIFGRLVDRIGSRAVIISGLVFFVISLFLLGFLQKNVNYFYVSEALLGLGLAIRSPLSYIMLNEVPAEERASTQGVLIIFVSVGQLVGASMTGAFISSMPAVITGFTSSFLIMMAVALILLISSFFLKRREAERIKIQ